MNRKGQAAMEFLMTYGWAILAAIIAIGVLAYFGVFSPTKFVSDNYIVNAPFNIRTAVINSSGITLELLNGAGETVNVTSISVTGCTAISPGTNHATGTYVVYTITTGCTGLTSGSVYRGDVVITYTKSGSTLATKSTGSIVAKVQ